MSLLFSRYKFKYRMMYVTLISVIVVMMIFEVSIVHAYSHVPWITSSCAITTSLSYRPIMELRYHHSNYFYHHRARDMCCSTGIGHICTHRSNSRKLMTKLHQTKKDDDNSEERDGASDIDTANNNNNSNSNFIQTLTNKIADFKPIMFIDQKTFVNLFVGAITGIVLSLTAVLWIFYSEDLTTILPSSLAYSSSTVDQTTSSQEMKVYRCVIVW